MRTLNELINSFKVYFFAFKYYINKSKRQKEKEK